MQPKKWIHYRDPKTDE